MSISSEPAPAVAEVAEPSAAAPAAAPPPAAPVTAPGTDAAEPAADPANQSLAERAGGHKRKVALFMAYVGAGYMVQPLHSLLQCPPPKTP